jgi:hypothetical protein
MTCCGLDRRDSNLDKDTGVVSLSCTIQNGSKGHRPPSPLGFAAIFAQFKRSERETDHFICTWCSVLMHDVVIKVKDSLRIRSLMNCIIHSLQSAEHHEIIPWSITIWGCVFRKDPANIIRPNVFSDQTQCYTLHS